jgi:hypothetical protein
MLLLVALNLVECVAFIGSTTSFDDHGHTPESRWDGQTLNLTALNGR